MQDFGSSADGDGLPCHSGHRVFNTFSNPSPPRRTGGGRYSPVFVGSRTQTPLPEDIEPKVPLSPRVLRNWHRSLGNKARGPRSSSATVGSNVKEPNTRRPQSATRSRQFADGLRTPVSWPAMDNHSTLMTHTGMLLPARPRSQGASRRTWHEAPGRLDTPRGKISNYTPSIGSASTAASSAGKTASAISKVVDEDEKTRYPGRRARRAKKKVEEPLMTTRFGSRDISEAYAASGPTVQKALDHGHGFIFPDREAETLIEQHVLKEALAISHREAAGMATSRCATSGGAPCSPRRTHPYSARQDSPRGRCARSPMVQFVDHRNRWTHDLCQTGADSVALSFCHYDSFPQ